MCVEWDVGKGVWSGMWARECGVGCGQGSVEWDVGKGVWSGMWVRECEVWSAWGGGYGLVDF